MSDVEDKRPLALQCPNPVVAVVTASLSFPWTLRVMNTPEEDTNVVITLLSAEVFIPHVSACNSLLVTKKSYGAEILEEHKLEECRKHFLA